MSTTAAPTTVEKKKFTLLVVGGNQTNYYDLFAPYKNIDDETELVVEQASFEDISCTGTFCNTIQCMVICLLTFCNYLRNT